jgi:hypothetical protein
VTRFAWGILSVLPWLGVVGCAAGLDGQAGPKSMRIDPAALATSPPVQPDAEWRVRVPLGTEPLADHVCRLSDQYELIEIRSSAKWRSFCQMTGLADCDAAPDFSKGTVVGLIASVGEPVDGSWPTDISEIRLQRDGAAWIRTRFRTGVYRPLLSDAYCNLAYVKGLSRVILVEINRRAFLTAQ